MDGNLMDVDLSDLDLNQEPTDPPLARYGSLLNELETAHDRIEERIRQLESVTARSRQRQARNSLDISYSPTEIMVDLSQGGNPNENNNIGVVESSGEMRKGYKRDSSHLVAKALETSSEIKKADKEGGSFYDCNICLDVAKDPILTCCGHLFCWPCFYQVSDIDSTCKECPVCKGEVSVNTVIPIYGNGDGERVSETELGLKIPPRPNARRVESIRQQHVTQRLSHVPVAEALRRIRVSIGGVGQQTQEGGGGGGGVLNLDTAVGQNAESVGGHRIRIHQVSRVLSESAASLSSLSSALSNAERLVEDLETVINNRLLRNHAQALSVHVGNLFARHSGIQANNQPPDSTGDINASSSQSTDFSGSVHVLSMRASGDVNLPASPSSSRRRRSIISRNLDLDSRDSRESRRRRLN